MRCVEPTLYVVVVLFGACVADAATVDFEDIPASTTYGLPPNFSPNGISQGVQFQVQLLPSNPVSGCCAVVDAFGMVAGTQEMDIDSVLVAFQLGHAAEVGLDYAFPSSQSSAVDVQIDGGPVFSVQDIMDLQALGDFTVLGTSNQGRLIYHGHINSTFGIGGTDAFIDNLTFSPASADFDQDGDVDGDDFLTWQASFGVDAGGDADGDGDTDGDDFLMWQSEFGSGSHSASSTVPEPASIVLLLVMAAIGVLVRRSGIDRLSR